MNPLHTVCGILTACVLILPRPSLADAVKANYLVCVTNERGGDVTLIDGATHAVVATLPVGKRPRGIHPSPDGRTLYVALSGRPIEGPPQLDASGNPIF